MTGVEIKQLLTPRGKILRALKDNPDGFSIKDLARAVRVPIGEVFNILDNLKDSRTTELVGGKWKLTGGR